MDLSIIIPTYNEKNNMQELLEKIYSEFKKNKIKGEVIVVDDGSPDGTGDIVEALKKRHRTLQCIHRQNKSGLSSAVLKGFSISKSKILGVMDADLSHPCEKINLMYQTIKKDNFDLVIGSRYVDGGGIKGWGLYRKVLSKGAIVLARFFTEVKDPMAGYFFIKKKCLEGVEINPQGFKILLEVLIKARCYRVQEIPIIFVNRTKGKSKAGIREIIYYLENLISYLSYNKEASNLT